MLHKNHLTLCFLHFFLLSFVIACDTKVKEKPHQDRVKKSYVAGPEFNSDSAFHFIQEQVDFGPRVPNSEPHQKCGDFLANKLQSFGAEVTLQTFSAVAYNNTTLHLKNIIASFNPDKQKRILLAAHWDTRPFADKDTINMYQPIDGANDGGSGVGVLLEVARLFGINPNANIGLDLILFDGEDYGIPKFEKQQYDTPWAGYCLGSQHWSKNKHKANYSAYFGILLDMVGARESRFFKESTSVKNAPSIVEKVWDIANQFGYNTYFVHNHSQEVLDDHVFVNKYARIPMIDIIDYDPDQFFGSYHHTHQDNMNIINKTTLKAVGQTVINVLYNE